MDENTLKNLLWQRLYLELQVFKYSVLQQSKEEIYHSSYQIEIFVNIYEILMEELEDLDEETMTVLLYQNGSILVFFYEEWLAREDSIYEELKNCIIDELDNVGGLYDTLYGKEDEDNGAGSDQAA